MKPSRYFVIGSRAVTAALIACLWLGVPSAVASNSRAARAQASTSSPVRGALHRAGRWLVDPEGRVVILHGFNVVQKNPPYVRTEFGSRDARLLAHEGFTVVRLAFLWAGVEPQPGRYDNAYIARVLKISSLLARHGIRTLLDFHQDGWSATALPGLGDGAPAWATVGSNSAQSADDSFAAFWRNAPGPGGVGIQTRFLDAWHHVARVLKSDSNVIGIDPFNEPYPGSDYPAPCGPFTRCPQFERGALAAFYRRVTGAIRSAGAAQVLFPEGVSDDTEPPVLLKLRDPQAGFNFHYYCGLTQELNVQVPVGAASPQTKACAPLERRHLGAFIAYAKHLDVPGFLSEFSCNDIDPDNAQIADLVDSTFTSWTAWAYYPKDIGSDCPNQGLLRRDGDPASAKQDKLDALSVPYAVAIAGTPISTSLTRVTRTYRLSYRSAGVPGTHLQPGAQTVVFLPAHIYPHGYKVEVHGARVGSTRNARWLSLTSFTRRAVSLRVTP